MIYMNNRQENILSKMMESVAYFTSKDISEIFNISLRTAQNDLKVIANYCDERSIEYTYNKQFGYKILSKVQITSSQADDSQIRIKYILRLLLFSNTCIKLDRLANGLFISNTTLVKDINKVKQILENYNLFIESKPYHGSCVIGTEKDKRNCIINENLITFHENSMGGAHKPYIDMDCLSVVSSVVSSVLITNKFNITDRDFQNFLMIAYLSTVRSINACYLEEDFMRGTDFKEAYAVAEKIVQKIAEPYHFEIHESEIRFLASVLHGKNSLITTEIIPTSIEEDVANILDCINSTLNIDFSYSIELRVSLSLHLIPLYERIETHNLLKEVAIQNIHNMFSYSFELALIAAQYINEKKNVVLTEAEIAYLAIHFNVILEKDGNASEKKNILFICSSRRSDTLLIKSGIYSHFANRIGQIDVKNIYEIKNMNLKNYDVVFSTTLNNENIPKNVIKLNHFLTETDYNAIEFALNHGSVFKMIEPLFSKKRFISNLNANSKDEVLTALSKLSTEIVDQDELYTAVHEREKNGYTSYENLIALPHPNYLLVKKSFCSVAILDKPVLWSEEKKAQIIILCCASKYSAKDLQMLFSFISLLFDDAKRVQQIIENPTYEFFMDCLRHLQNTNV